MALKPLTVGVIIASALTLFAIIFSLIWKKWWIIGGWMGILLLIAVIAIIWKVKASEEPDNSNKPKTLTEDECMELLKKELKKPEYMEIVGEIDDMITDKAGLENEKTERTPIRTILFKGYYNPMTRYAFIVNKNTGETSLLKNKSDEEIRERINRMADNPMVFTTKRDKIVRDELGGVQKVTETQQLTKQQLEQKKENEAEAEAENV